MKTPILVKRWCWDHNEIVGHHDSYCNYALYSSQQPASQPCDITAVVITEVKT